MASYGVRWAGRARAAAGTALMWGWPSSALIIPATDAEPTVARWLGQDRVDFDGAPLHVTVMYPFLPARKISGAEEEAVAELASGIEPFSYALARIDRFPGVTYLAPEPADPFIRMTGLVQLRWPSCVPYGGAYDDVVPHMAVALGDRQPADPARLEECMPITMRAEEMWLIEQTPRGWRTRSRFALGRMGSEGAHRQGAGAAIGSPDGCDPA